MGFRKFANAALVKPFINMDGWDKIRQQGTKFQDRSATRVVLQEYDPQNYLLSHCTIVASVDTENPGLPTGRQMVAGTQIDRRYPDYLISSGSSKYINNNNDAWERKLLLSSFRTFIGGDNFVEHLQIPELSKGKIVDAAARDIGDSIYIDILVATNKKHRPLIAAIESGQLKTLSMGCQVSFTICSKCGNVAEDELQLCNDIRYFKGNDFFDSHGVKRKIAELCGHIACEPGSVKFIEASWVANPAFTGAVLRSILSPSDLPVEMRQRMQVAFNEPTRVADPSLFQKAAYMVAPEGVDADMFTSLLAQAQASYAPVVARVSDRRQVVDARLESLVSEVTRRVLLAQDQFPMQDSAPAEEKPEEDPLKKPSDEIYNKLVEHVVDRVKKDMSKDETSKVRDVIDENSNETLIRSALRSPIWRKRAEDLVKSTGSPALARKLFEGLVLYKAHGWAGVRASKKFNGRDMLAVSHLVDRLSKKSSIAGTQRIYRTVLAVGGTSPYQNVDAYLAACRRVVGRDLTHAERSALVEKGHLYAMGVA